MKKYNGKVVWVDGKPYGIAERVSPSILIFAQDTGRWSQKGPPLAQLPERMRYLIGLDPGHRQVGYDYSGIEAQILARLSGDQIMLDAFAKNWDLHTLNACDLFGLEYPSDRTKACHIVEGGELEEWRKLYGWAGEDDPRRKFAKIFLYRTMYGGSAKAAYTIPGAAKLGLSRTELEQAVYRWLAAHPNLREFWDRNGQDAIEKFCVRSVSGRRRILTAINEDSRFREGINHPIQSLVSDIVNMVVIETKELGAPYTLSALHPDNPVQLMGQMHDSLLWQIPEVEYDKLLPRIIQIAEAPREWGGITFGFPVEGYEKRLVDGEIVKTHLDKEKLAA
jgi:DNA polymerase-1